MRHTLTIALFALCLAGGAIALPPAHTTRPATPRSAPEAPPEHPYWFEANAGQFSSDAAFGLRNGPRTVAFASHGITFAGCEGAGVTMCLPGSNSSCEIVGELESDGVANYIHGADRSMWKSNVAMFGRVRYREIYPGIDLVFYGRDGQLEYDFIVEPGANPDTIGLWFDGADSVTLTPSHDLAVTTGPTTISHKAPVAYQEMDGRQSPVSASYRECEREVVRFEIGAFDPTLPLVVDPGIVFSTELGGGLWDRAGAVATDASGNIYVTGWTSSLTFPTRNPILPFNPGTRPDGTGAGDCFVSKFTPDGSSLVFSTYIGGGMFDEGTAIAVGSDGAVYVAGTTWSNDFPTIHPVRTNNDFYDNPYSDAITDPFVFKISPDGSDLVYSTYLGGSLFDEARDICVDPSGAAIVAGTTGSTDLLTTPTAFQPVDPNINSSLGNSNDGFISKVDPSGSHLEFSTYVGGTYILTSLSAMTTAENGDILVTGYTYETHLLQSVPQIAFGRRGQGDVFVVDFSSDGATARWSTLIGGSLLDEGRDVATDSFGNIYVAGMTTSQDFPTVQPIQTEPDGEFIKDAVLLKLTPDGQFVVYSTYLGGTSDDVANALVVNEDRSVIVAGSTSSTDFPVVLANYPYPIHLSGPDTDGFVAKVGATGSTLEQSTFFGGYDPDSIEDLAALPGGDVAATGYCGGIAFPVLNAFLENTFDDSVGDAFVTRFRFSPLGPAPVISTAKGRTGRPGKPARAKISGRGFKPGAVVFTGIDPYITRVFNTEVSANGKSIVVTDANFDLHQLFNGRGAHTVIVTNPDGGQAILHYQK